MGAELGQPDLIILHNKEVTFVEFKFDKGKKSANQISCCAKLEKWVMRFLNGEISKTVKNG